MTDTILISGPDGSGKSTIAKHIARILRKRGYPVYYVWLRYPRLLSIFPLLISKITSRTIKIEKRGLCLHKYHAFYTLPPLGKLYEIAILLDYIIYRTIKVWIPNKLGYVVIVDRSMLDIAIDIYIETRRIPAIILRYLSYEAMNINSSSKLVIIATYKNLLSRRKDNFCNPFFKAVIELYKRLGLIYNYKIVKNNTIYDVKHVIKSITTIYKPIRVYSDPSNQLIRALYYKHCWLMYITNFIFQTTGYMWRLELAFRIIIQIFIIIFFIYIGTNPLWAFLVSHMILYPFYAKILDFQKWSRRPLSSNVSCKFVRAVRKLQTYAKNNVCLDIFIVGSLSRNPNIILTKKIDLDIRIVPRTSLKCVLKAFLLAMYLRMWGLLNRIPIDLYVKPITDPEIITMGKNLSRFQWQKYLLSCQEA